MASLGLSREIGRKRPVEGLLLFPLSMSDTRERRVDRTTTQSMGEVFSSRDRRALALARLVDVEGMLRMVFSFSDNLLYGFG